MPGSSAAKAKHKVLYVPDAIITITGGIPDPADVFIKANGTVQFVNKDETNWRVRLFTREHERHADVDLFCPARSSVTVLGPANGECKYEVIESAGVATGPPEVETGKRNGGGSITRALALTSKSHGGGGGGGGTIRIGPTP